MRDFLMDFYQKDGVGEGPAFFAGGGEGGGEGVTLAEAEGTEWMPGAGGLAGDAHLGGVEGDGPRSGEMAGTRLSGGNVERDFRAWIHVWLRLVLVTIHFVGPRFGYLCGENRRATAIWIAEQA